MNDELCPHDDAVQQALRSDNWSGSLRDHVAACAQCAETERVALWMQGLAQRLSAAAAPPDPMLIWLRARLAERERLERQQLRRRVVATGCLQLAAGLALSFLLIRLGPAAVASLSRLDELAALAGLQSDEGLLAWVVVPVIVLTALVTSYWVLYRPLRFVRGAPK